MTQHFRFQAARSFVPSALLLSCLVLALAIGCQGKAPTKPEEATTSAAKEKPSGQENAAAKKPNESPSISGREVLSRMIVAYRKATSYSDAGKIRLVAEGGKEPHDETFDFAVAMVRPNKLRVNAYQATFACDGQRTRAALGSIPGQILDKPAPQKIDMKIFRADPNLAGAVTRDFAGMPPQLLFLLADDPMTELLRDAEEPELTDPGDIDGRTCYRVKLKSSQGAATLWIDQQSLELRRIVYPTDAIREDLARRGAPPDDVSLIAEFAGARLDAKVDPKAFEFPIPEKAEVVTMFVPPHTAQLLGKQLPDVTFHDLDGKPITRESLAGKPAVLDFWFTTCPPCRVALPELQKVYRQQKDKAGVAFYAVSVDNSQVENKELAKVLDDLKVDMPILRDDKEQAARLLKVFACPTTLIIDAKGVVQYYLVAAEEKLSDVLPDMLEKVAAGKNVYEPLVKKYEEALDRLRKDAEQFEKGADGSPEPGAGSGVTEERLPETKPAPKSEPATMKLTQFWKSADVKEPGNIAVLTGKDGPRLAVVDGWRSIVEVGLDGKLVALHKLNMAEGENVGYLRVAAGADGKRYVVAWMLSAQRCFVLDENWNQVAAYPEDALKNPHSGINDVQLGDFNGDGKLEMCVSYAGVVGVKSVSLDGKPLWSNRSLSNVLGMAVGPADSKAPNDGRVPTSEAQSHQTNRHYLYCTNDRGTVVALDDKGQPQGETKIADRIVRWISCADPRGDNKPSWCAITWQTWQKPGEQAALGFDLDGHELWSYPLPKGAQMKPIEPIISGKLTRNGPAQWILPGPDGSVHVISAEGKPVDKFNTGIALQGLATAEVDGKPLLITASTDGLMAFKVE